MKISHLLLSLVSVSLTVVSAQAYTTGFNPDRVQLPNYTVTAPRLNPVAQQIARNLEALRSVARNPLTVRPELPLLRNPNPASSAAKPAPASVLAKS